MAVNKEQCSAMVAPNDRWGAFHQSPCMKKAVIERGSKLFCKIHDPEYIAKRDEKLRLIREAKGCQKCHANLKSYHPYCPWCGTKRHK